MSANNQIIVAPFPEDLDKWGVWHDGCVDNPFDFSAKPIAVFDDLEAAMEKAGKEEEPDEMGFCVEYGIHFIPRSAVTGYEKRVWDEFPDYKYLAVAQSGSWVRVKLVHTASRHSDTVVKIKVNTIVNTKEGLISPAPLRDCEGHTELQPG